MVAMRVTMLRRAFALQPRRPSLAEAVIAIDGRRLAGHHRATIEGRTTLIRALSLFVAALAVGCGSSSSGPPLPASATNFAGVYAATYSGTYAVTSPAGTPGGSNTASGTITITDLSDGDLGISFELAGNPPSGAIDFALMGNTGMAVGAATGGLCFTGQVDGNTQSNCCTACSITFTGSNMFTQPNAGTFTGTTSTGAPYAGTYDGTWTGTKQ
jgi:hypothetical protein